MYFTRLQPKQMSCPLAPVGPQKTLRAEDADDMESSDSAEAPGRGTRAEVDDLSAASGRGTRAEVGNLSAASGRGVRSGSGDFSAASGRGARSGSRAERPHRSLRARRAVRTGRPHRSTRARHDGPQREASSARVHVGGDRLGIGQRGRRLHLRYVANDPRDVTLRPGVGPFLEPSVLQCTCATCG